MFLGIFREGVKIYHFSSENIFGQVLWTFGDFFLVTLVNYTNSVPKLILFAVRIATSKVIKK